MDPVVIQCAVTGSADAGPPNLPSSPAAIVESALAAWEAGAAVLHLHAREDDGTPTQAVDRFAALVDAIRAAGCDAVLNLSTGSAGGRASYEQRMAVLELAPEMASFDAGTINFGARIFEGERHFLHELAGRFREHGVVPEIECFDTGYLGTLHELVADGTLDPGPLVNAYCLLAGGHVAPAWRTTCGSPRARGRPTRPSSRASCAWPGSCSAPSPHRRRRGSCSACAPAEAH